MSIRLRWTAVCDAPDCEACVPLLGDQHDGKWELGLTVSESGWQASPGADETFCTEHVGSSTLADEGCDCTELCSMGPTCPGGMLAGLPGSGCYRKGDAS